MQKLKTKLSVIQLLSDTPRKTRRIYIEKIIIKKHSLGLHLQRPIIKHQNLQILHWSYTSALRESRTHYHKMKEKKKVFFVIRFQRHLSVA